MFYAIAGRSPTPRQSCTAAGPSCAAQNKTAGLILPFGQCAFRGSYFPLFTTFFSSLPGVNFTTRRAAILMVAPVCGLRPLRALRCETENVPKPIKATRSPLRREEVMLSTVVSIAVVACALEILQAPAIRSTRSALFMVSPETNRFVPHAIQKFYRCGNWPSSFSSLRAYCQELKTCGLFALTIDSVPFLHSPAR